jgi:hypothetical protein
MKYHQFLPVKTTPDVQSSNLKPRRNADKPTDMSQDTYGTFLKLTNWKLSGEWMILFWEEHKLREMCIGSFSDKEEETWIYEPQAAVNNRIILYGL